MIFFTLGAIEQNLPMTSRYRSVNISTCGDPCENSRICVGFLNTSRKSLYDSHKTERCTNEIKAIKETAARQRAPPFTIREGCESFTQSAQRAAASFASFDPHARFRAVVDEVTADGERDDQGHDPLTSG